MKKWVALAAAMAAVMLLSPASSGATDFSGRISTIVEWFDDPEGDTALPLYLYGNLNARNMGGVKGLNFLAYGRAAKDLAGEVERKSNLYYGYLEKLDLLDGMDIRMGRQFITTTAGASTIDGLDIDYSPRKAMFGAKFFVGGAVHFFEDEYNRGDWAIGGEFSFKPVRTFDLSASYYQENDGGDIAKELIGIDSRYDVRGYAQFTGEYQYNYLNREVSRLFFEGDYYGLQDFDFKAHYLFDMPVFKATSIYSVFAVDQYEELALEAAYGFSGGTRGLFRFTNEMYEVDRDAQVYEIGVEKVGKGELTGYALVTYRNDPDGQDMKGVKLSASYKFSDLVQPGFGIHIDVLERFITEDEFTTSKRYWISWISKFSDTWSMEARVELSQNNLYDEYYRGRLQANYRF